MTVINPSIFRYNCIIDFKTKFHEVTMDEKALQTKWSNSASDIGRIMTENDLYPFISLHAINPSQSTDIVIGTYALAKAISYVFQVPLPKLMRESKSANYFYNVCRFPAEDIPKIQSQVDGADMKCLSEGTIPLWVLLFMANSPRFPYTLHVSRTSDDVAYYDFILKRELLIPKPTKEI